MTGAELRRLRKRLGMTQLELADRIGVTANTLARWERDLVGIGEVAARWIRSVASAVPKSRRAKR